MWVISAVVARIDPSAAPRVNAYEREIETKCMTM
jgi:hypothetical protein